MGDVAIALTDSLDRQGRGGMLVPFQNADGVESAPGMTWGSEPTSGFYRAGSGDQRVSILGNDLMRWNAGIASIWVTDAWEQIITSGPFNLHVDDTDIHFLQTSIDHEVIQNVGVNTHLEIDTHIADLGIHFTVGSILHGAIQNVGVHTHAAIDTHIDNLDIHFDDAPADGVTYGRNDNEWEPVTALSVKGYTSDPTADLEPDVESGWNDYADRTGVTRPENEISMFNWPGTSNDLYQYIGSQIEPPWTSTDSDWNLTGGGAAVWGAITGTLSDQTDLVDELNLKTDQTAFNTHTSDGSIHFVVGSIDHTVIQNIGTNSHLQIDTHIADLDIHYIDAPTDGMNYVRNNNLWALETVGVTVHGALSGLTVDDHPQYLTEGRGDVRYPSQAAFDAHTTDLPIHFEDAPTDGLTYGRNDNNWVSVSGSVVVGYTSNAAGDLEITVEAGWNTFADDTAVVRLANEISLFNWPSTGTDIYQYLGSQLVGPWTTVADDWNLTGGGAAVWGAITGTLGDQTDLQDALDLKNTVVAFDAHTGDLGIHFTVASISHGAIQDIGVNSHIQLDSHLNDAAIHFTVGSILHSSIQDIGTNTHPQLDTHLGTGNIHFLQTAIDHLVIQNVGTNTHVELDGHLASSANPHGVTAVQAGALAVDGLIDGGTY